VEQQKKCGGKTKNPVVSKQMFSHSVVVVVVVVDRLREELST
jgi:hypothetical protein